MDTGKSVVNSASSSTSTSVSRDTSKANKDTGKASVSRDTSKANKDTGKASVNTASELIDRNNSSSSRKIDINDLSSDDLLRLRAELDQEIAKRKFKR